jgi:hypothetical protein
MDIFPGMDAGTPTARALHVRNVLSWFVAPLLSRDVTVLAPERLSLEKQGTFRVGESYS